MLSVEERLKRAVFKACLDRLRMPDESSEHLEHLATAYACMAVRTRATAASAAAASTAVDGESSTADAAPMSKAELVAAIGARIRDFVRATDGCVLANLSAPHLMGLARLMDPAASWPKSKQILVMALQAEHARRDPPPPRSDPVFVPLDVVQPPVPRPAKQSAPAAAAGVAPLRRARGSVSATPTAACLPAAAAAPVVAAPAVPSETPAPSAIDRAFGVSAVPFHSIAAPAGDELFVADGPSVRVAPRRDTLEAAAALAPAPMVSPVNVERAIHGILQALGAITVDVLQKRVAKTSPEHRQVTIEQIRSALEALQAQDVVMVEHGIVYATS